jgi:hypothetical protein
VRRIPSRLAFLLLLVCAVAPVRAIRQAPGGYDIRSFGARGESKSVDSDAINSSPFAVLRDVADLTVRNVSGVADGRHTRIPAGTLLHGQQ